MGWFLHDRSLRRLPLWAAFGAMMGIGALSVAWSAWALVLLPLVALHVQHRRLPSDLDALATVPPPGPSFPCRVEVFYDATPRGLGVMLGTDDGIVTFVDGWLHFAGERTEFSFRPVEVASVSPWRGTTRLVLRNAGTVAFSSVGDSPRHELGELGRAIGVWSTSTIFPVGEPVLPPRHVHPSGLARAWRGVIATTTAAMTVMFCVDLAYYFVFRHSGGVPFGFVGTGFVLVHTGRLGTLRRLAREDRAALANENQKAISP